MRSRAHTIARVKFETVLDRRERVRPVQDRISRFAAGALQDVLTEALSRFEESQRISVFRAVEIDLGEISIEHLERDLEEGIARQLRAWALRKAPRLYPNQPDTRAWFLSQSAQGAGSEPESESWPSEETGSSAWRSPEDAAAEVLDFTGALDGSWDDSSGTSDKKPQTQQHWLTVLRDNPALRARIVAGSAPARLPAMLRAWMPGHSETIVEFAILLCRLHNELSLAPADREAFQTQLWRCILDEAADYRAANFSLPAFLRRIVERLARYRSLPYSVLARQIAQGWKRRPDFALRSYALIPILQQFHEHAASRYSTPALPSDRPTVDRLPVDRPFDESRPATAVFSAPESLRDLARFLEWGILPWSGPSAGTEIIESEMLSTLESAADQVCTMIRSLGEREPVRKRIAVQFSEAVVERLIAELDPVNAPWMLLCTKQLRLLHRQKPLMAIQNRDFGHLLAELTLEYLSERHWHALDAVSFLRFLLLRLAYRQKLDYEMLLADLALRRSPDSSEVHPGGEIDPQSRLNAAIETLIETDLLGIRNRLAHAPRFAVRPDFRHLYCDLDVLAYWIRWRKLPAWSLNGRPREAVQSLSPLIEEFPPDLIAEAGANADRPRSRNTTQQIPSPAASYLTPALQIERWLLLGLWPAEIDAPEDSALDRWLQDRTDTDWLRALENCEGQDRAIRRLARLAPERVLRIARLLSGPNAETVQEFLLALQGIGQPLEGSFSPPWKEHVNRYALALLLQDAPAQSQSSAFLHNLAHTTLLALSLSFQIPYERLLFLLRRECDGPSSLQNLCAALENDLENREQPVAPGLPSCPGCVEAEASGIEASKVARIYLRSGRLPSEASGLSFASVKQIVRRLTSTELASIVAALGNAGGKNVEILVRAEKLLSPEQLLELKRLCRDADLVHTQKRPDQTCTQNGWTGGRPRPHGQADLEPRQEPRMGSEPRSPRFEASLSRAESLFEDRESLLGNLDAFVFFLRNGAIPWWAARELSGPSSQWLQPMQERVPDDLLKTLRAAASSPHMIERLLRYAPRDCLAELIRRAEPGFGGAIVLYLYAGEELANDGELTVAQRSRAAVSHWRAALQFLLDSCPPRRSFSATLHSLSRRVSQQLGLSEGRYLDRLAKVAEDRAEQGSGQKVLSEVLVQLRKIDALSEAEAKSSGDRVADWDGKHVSQPEEAASRPEAARPVESNRSLGLSAQPFHRKNDAGETSLFPQLSPEAAGGNRTAHDRNSHGDKSDGRNEREFTAASGTLRPSPGEESGDLSIANPLETAGQATYAGKDSSASTSRDATEGRNSAEEPVDVRKNEASLHEVSFQEVSFLPDPTTEAGRLEYLLRFGALPESAEETLDEFMASLADGIDRHPEKYRELIERTARLAMERRRIVEYFPAGALEAVWKLLLPTGHGVARLCMEELAAAARSASPLSRCEEVNLICAEELLETSALAAGTDWDLSTYLRRALPRLSADHALGAVEIVASLRGRFSRQPEPLRTRLNRALERAERETARLPNRHRPATPPSPLARPPRPAPQLPAGEPFYIANAGAILLWPFLGRYFQTLGLMEENAFLDESARSRAIYLVQYLVTGTAEAPEQALLLNKILCGAPPAQPMEAAPAVSDEEAVLSTQMLEGVIANWGKLGNTSIAGLRESFLIREGRLLRKESDNSWALTVSVKGYDILLDALPWRLSMIRLPWMQTLLTGKWR